MPKTLITLCLALLVIALPLQANALRTVPTDNLVAHYLFTGNADDASGNGHHGTVFGATLCADRFGDPEGAYHFDSVEQDYIRVPDHPDLQIATNLTISVWIRHEAAAGYFEDIVMKGNDSYGFQFNNDSDAVLFHLKQAGGGWRNLNSYHIPVPGQWFNVVGTFDGSTQIVYVNGVQANSASWNGSIETNASPLDFGYRVAGDNTWYDGELDDFRVYDRALTADEVMQLYNETGNYLGVPLEVDIGHAGGNVTVSWQAVPGADSYRVYSSEVPDAGFSLDESGVFDGSSWTAPATEPRRFYLVRAVGD